MAGDSFCASEAGLAGRPRQRGTDAARATPPPVEAPVKLGKRPCGAVRNGRLRGLQSYRAEGIGVRRDASQTSISTGAPSSAVAVKKLL
jgi:hypothetical protein